MSNLYERREWKIEAKRYETVASCFHVLAVILGFLGVVMATIMLVIAISDFDDGGLLGLLPALLLGLQSLMIVFFGMLMRVQSRILLAVFEMSVAETRDKLTHDVAGP